MTEISLYGIPNCDTVKKARAWLDAKGIAYTFHDYKKEGADPAKLRAWIAAKGCRRRPALARSDPRSGLVARRWRIDGRRLCR